MNNEIKYIIKDNTPYMVLEFVEVPLNIQIGNDPVQIGIQEAYKVYQKIDLSKIDFLIEHIKSEVESYKSSKEKFTKQLSEIDFLSGPEMEKFFESILAKSDKYSKKKLGNINNRLAQYNQVKALKEQIAFASKQLDVYQKQYDFLVEYKNK